MSNKIKYIGALMIAIAAIMSFASTASAQEAEVSASAEAQAEAVQVNCVVTATLPYITVDEGTAPYTAVEGVVLPDGCEGPWEINGTYQNNSEIGPGANHLNTLTACDKSWAVERDGQGPSYSFSEVSENCPKSFDIVIYREAGDNIAAVSAGFTMTFTGRPIQQAVAPAPLIDACVGGEFHTGMTEMPEGATPPNADGTCGTVEISVYNPWTTTPDVPPAVNPTPAPAAPVVAEPVKLPVTGTGTYVLIACGLALILGGMKLLGVSNLAKLENAKVLV